MKSFTSDLHCMFLLNQPLLKVCLSFVTIDSIVTVLCLCCVCSVDYGDCYIWTEYVLFLSFVVRLNVAIVISS